VNGTGWIPVNLSLISSGSPLGNLPVDPTNNSSSKLYYTYTTNGTQYEATAAMESAKYSVGGSNDVISNDGGTLASVYEKGSKFGLEPMDYGDSSLMGLWTFDEGTNTVAYDYSGNNNTGTWSGTQAGTNGYYSAGKIGPYAGNFDGSTDIITGSTFVLASSLPLTISYWVNQKVFSANAGIVAFGTSTPFFSSVGGAGAPLCGYYNGTSYYFSSGNVLSNNVWYFITCVYNANKTVTTYQNGVLIATSGAWSTNTPTGNLTFWIGSLLSGLLDDVRIYNRALSATQIAAMYNGGK